MSDDGSTIVGWYDVNGPRLGVRWVNGQVAEFGTPTFPVGEALNVTPDGSTIVGMNAGLSQNPWLWTSAGGLQLLDRVAPNFNASANAVSDNGRIVAGLGGSTSFFPGDFSGRLLEEAGLKGFSVGPVGFSTLHSNFIVNSGGGTAAQARELIATAQERVYDRFGVRLTPEIEDLGELS